MEKTIEDLERAIKSLTRLLYFLVFCVGWTGAGIFVDVWFLILFVINVSCAVVSYVKLMEAMKLLNACKTIHTINKALSEKSHEANV